MTVLILAAACTKEETPPPVSEKPSICTDPRPDFVKLEYEALADFAISPEIQQEYSELFEGGSLKSFDALGTGPSYIVSRNRLSIGQLLDTVDGDANIGQKIYYDYEDEHNRKCVE